VTKDLRNFGFAPLADLVGKARRIWFSLGESGIRWARIGKDID
jgi:hypothetical protein